MKNHLLPDSNDNFVCSSGKAKELEGIVAIIECDGTKTQQVADMAYTFKGEANCFLLSSPLHVLQLLDLQSVKILFSAIDIDSGLVAQHWLGGVPTVLAPPRKLRLFFVVQCAMAIER